MSDTSKALTEEEFFYEDTFAAYKQRALAQYFRVARLKTNRDIWNDPGFPIPPQEYLAYEDGTIPEIQKALLLAKFFGLDATETSLVWALSNMKSKSSAAFIEGAITQHRKNGSPGFLKRFFGIKERPQDPSKIIISNNVPANAMHDTWIFSSKELEVFHKHPWIFDNLLKIRLKGGSVVASDFGLTNDASLERLASTYFKSFIADGNLLLKHRSGHDLELKLVKRHIHMPKTKEWDDFRNILLAKQWDNLSTTLHSTSEVVEARVGHRTSMRRYMTKQQYLGWLDRMANLELGLAMDQVSSRGSLNHEKLYGVLILCGETEISIPPEIKIELMENS